MHILFINPIPLKWVSLPFSLYLRLRNGFCSKSEDSEDVKGAGGIIGLKLEMY